MLPIDNQVGGRYAMIPALLYGKLSREQENMEDILTSCVFGILSYLPPEKGLLPFLKASEVGFGRPSTLQELGEDLNVTYRFWPQLGEQGTIDGAEVRCRPCEPDVLLELTGTGGKPVYALIEAKLHSGKSSWASEDTDAPNDQLAREWDNLQLLCARKGAEPLLVYLTADFSAPHNEIRQSAKEYLTKRPGGQFACAWLSWRQIPRVFRHAPENAQLQDLVKLCHRLNLRYFDRAAFFESPFDITWHYERDETKFRWLDQPIYIFGWRYGR
jgi:hypothetical protein